ncbi:MAG: sigma 54-interacting transcriptional regulator [Caldisericia bacterium]|nr:sigma 54-interacting transcriptional regulator [Caldisericia bacterium]
MERIKYFPWESLIDILLNYVDIGIHIVDKNGVTLFYNKANSKLEGLSEDEVIGKNILEVFPSLTPETSTLLKVLKTGEPIINKLQVFLTYKGKEITTLNTTFPLYYGGELIGAIELSRDITEVKKLSEKIIELQKEKMEEKQGKTNFPTLDDFITKDERILKIKETIKNVKDLDTPILLIGESQVGKRLLSQIIHAISERKDSKFLYLNCATIEESLIEETIFGLYDENQNLIKEGLIHILNGGTLYLANIDYIPLRIQDRLSFLLDTQELNGRLITSLENLPIFSIKDGKLKKDFYYKISKIEITIPPLRERKDDIRILSDFYLKKLNKKYKKDKKFGEDFLNFLLTYNFPGNVGELFYIIEYSYLNSEGKVLNKTHLPKSIYFKESSLNELSSEFEKRIIEEVLEISNNNISKASKILKIPRQTLQYKIKKYKVLERRKR